MMDAPPYDTVHQLMTMVGYFAPVMLEAQRDQRDQLGGIANLRHRARGERNERAWRAQDLALWPDYGDADDDTDEEYDADTGELVADSEEQNLLTEDEKVAKAGREQRATEAEIRIFDRFWGRRKRHF